MTTTIHNSKISTLAELEEFCRSARLAASTSRGTCVLGDEIYCELDASLTAQMLSDGSVVFDLKVKESEPERVSLAGHNHLDH